MNICIISSAFPSKKKLVINLFIYRQAKVLAERGHKVIVVAGDTEPRTEGNMIVYARPNALKSALLALKVALKIPKDAFWLLRNIGLRGTVGRLSLVEITCNLLKKERIDIIDGQWVDYGGVVAYLVSKIYKRRYIVSVLGSEIATTADGVVGVLLPNQKEIVSKVLDNACCIITVSKSLAKDVMKYCSKKPEIIPWGISLRLFKPQSERVFKRKTIISVGALIKRKGHDYLLKAFKKILDTGVDVDLLIVGQGHRKRELERLAKELGIANNVKFVDFIEMHELPKYYASSEFFALATLHEGFGLVFAEAMACGIPVISTNVAAVPETVGEGGILVEPRNTDKLAKAMLDLLKNENLRQKLRKKALEQAKKFSIEKRTDNLERVYFSVIKQI